MSTLTIEKSPIQTRKAASIALWVLALAAVSVFVPAGYAKLSGDPQMVAGFEAIGVGQWFRVLTGAIEIAASILLLIPGLQAFGALLLAPTMVGAAITHIVVYQNSPALPLGLLALVSVIAIGRREQVFGLLRRLGVLPRA